MINCDACILHTLYSIWKRQKNVGVLLFHVEPISKCYHQVTTSFEAQKCLFRCSLLNLKIELSKRSLPGSSMLVDRPANWPITKSMLIARLYYLTHILRLGDATSHLFNGRVDMSFSFPLKSSFSTEKIRDQTPHLYTMQTSGYEDFSRRSLVSYFLTRAAGFDVAVSNVRFLMQCTVYSVCISWCNTTEKRAPIDLCRWIHFCWNVRWPPTLSHDCPTSTLVCHANRPLSNVSPCGFRTN